MTTSDGDRQGGWGSSWARRLGWGRSGLVLASVGSGWLVLFLSEAVEGPTTVTPELASLLGGGWRGLLMAMLFTAGCCGGLAAGGLVLNDALDVRRDRWRVGSMTAGGSELIPITCGVGWGGASPGWMAMGMVLMLGAVACATGLGRGAVLLSVLVSAGAVLYNLVWRFVLAAGVVGLGLLLALGMSVPNPRMAFAWPVLLVFTHTVVWGLLEQWAGGLAESWKKTQIAGVLAGWAFWSLAIVTISSSRGGEGVEAMGPWGWGWPVAAGVGYAAAMVWAWRRPGRRASLVRSLSVGWLLIYAVAWLAGAGHWGGAGLVVGLAGVQAVVARLIGRGRRGLSYRV